jgi:hypothetical protein
LSFIEFGDGFQEFKASASQILFSLNIFEDDSHGELAPLLDHGQTTLGRAERPLGELDLILERLKCVKASSTCRATSSRILGSFCKLASQTNVDESSSSWLLKSECRPLFHINDTRARNFGAGRDGNDQH